MDTEYRRMVGRVGGHLSLSEWSRLRETVAGAKEVLEVGHYTGLSTSALLGGMDVSGRLTSVDHHEGDFWIGPSERSYINDVVKEYSPEDRPQVELVFRDFRDRVALDMCLGPFDYVFYDADHESRAVHDFWNLYEPRFAGRCVLAFDDCDWPGMTLLESLAVKLGGFIDVTERSIFRDRGQKVFSDTYTVRVMKREF